MDRTVQQERRLRVLARYQAYVDALRTWHMDLDSLEVRESRRALARSIEEACSEDPDLLADFKRAFASRPRA